MTTLITEYLASVGIHVSGMNIGPFRIGGPGLANLLWLWAKCIVFNHLTGAAVVWPQWNQLKPRALLRGELSMGWYWGFFKKPEAGYIFYKDRASLWRLSGDLLLKKILQGEEIKIEEGTHYMMSDISDPFTSMFEYDYLIRNAWLEMIDKARKPNLIYNKPSLAIHLRRGDFRIAGLASDLEITKKILKNICHNFSDYHIYLMTDADAKDYEFWRIIPEKIKNSTTGHTLLDLIVLSRADYLVGTANSSYSRFAAFLGGMPVIWVGPEPSVILMSELYPKSIPIDF